MHPPCALTHFTTTRCSHPLCNTQQTTTPRTTQTPPPTPTAGVRCIHHVPLHTSPQQDARIHYATLNKQPHPEPPRHHHPHQPQALDASTMCPYTLHHNKMLASTTQHSTNNHTPNHPDTTTHTNRRR